MIKNFGKMSTFELLKELLKKPKEEIELAITSLMLIGKIDFLQINQSYINSLNHIKEDQLNKLIEAESCVMEGFLDRLVKENKDTPKGRRNYNHTQRCLYLLNESQRFNLQDVNKEYNYNEEVGKSMSVYERNKKEII